MRILIFGASGFIGTQLTQYLDANGYDVVALCRSGEVNNFKGECYKWDFNSALPSALKTNNIDCVLYLAHDFTGQAGASITIEKTLYFSKILRDLGVKRQIYFSSYSAGSHAVSLYGKTKFILENSLLCYEDTIIVRPGLVIGNGGIYSRIKKIAETFPIIPLPNGGAGLVPIISIERLCVEVLSIAQEYSPEREKNIFEKEYISLKNLILNAISDRKRKPYFISLPTSFFLFALKCAAFLRLPLSVNIDNLEGFLANQSATHLTSLKD